MAITHDALDDKFIEPINNLLDDRFLLKYGGTKTITPFGGNPLTYHRFKVYYWGDNKGHIPKFYAEAKMFEKDGVITNTELNPLR